MRKAFATNGADIRLLLIGQMLVDFMHPQLFLGLELLPAQIAKDSRAMLLVSVIVVQVGAREFLRALVACLGSMIVIDVIAQTLSALQLLVAGAAGRVFRLALGRVHPVDVAL